MQVKQSLHFPKVVLLELKTASFRSFFVGSKTFIDFHLLFQDLQKHYRLYTKKERNCSKAVSNLLQLQALLDQTWIHDSDL